MESGNEVKARTTKASRALDRRSDDEEIRQIAYHLWLDENCPDGRHHEHWLRAEDIWQAQKTTAAVKAHPTRALKGAETSAAKKPAAKTKPRRRQPTAVET